MVELTLLVLWRTVSYTLGDEVLPVSSVLATRFLSGRLAMCSLAKLRLLALLLLRVEALTQLALTKEVGSTHLDAMMMASWVQACESERHVHGIYHSKSTFIRLHVVIHTRLS